MSTGSAVPDTPPLSTYVLVVNAGPLHELRSERAGFDLGLYAAAVLAPMLERDAEELFDLTAKGLHLLRRAVRDAVPAARATTRCSCPRWAARWRTTAASRGATAFIYRDPPSYAEREVRALRAAARDGAHVVRGHGDHALVGRPLAQRVLRGVGLRLGRGRLHASSPTCGPACSPPRSRTPTPPTPHRPPTRSASRSPTSRPPPASFDDITYPKGAAVLKQLVAYVGEDAFVAGLRAYFRKHAWGNTTAGRPGRASSRRPAGATWPAGWRLAGDRRHRPAGRGARAATAPRWCGQAPAAAAAAAAPPATSASYDERGSVSRCARRSPSRCTAR